MRNRIFATAVALVIALGFGAPAAAGASVNAHGQCHDGSGSGGGGSVGADSGGNVDAVDADEAQSIASGLATFAQGTADDAQQGQLGEDACHSDDTDANGDETHDTEDHISVEASAQGDSAGACYDDEGFHTTADCHGGDGGELPSGNLALP